MFKDLRKSWRRIVRAGVVSLIGVASTWVWYNHGNKDRERSGQEAIAILVRAVNEVERKPMKRVIWEEVTNQDLLYPGESIRTSDISEASIKFLRGGTQIELEPDSLIVLSESVDKLAMNVLKGKLFVSDTGAVEQDVQITSGAKSVNVAEIKKTGGSLSVEEDSKESLLKVIGPLPHKVIYLNTLSKEKMAFAFEKVDSSYQIQIEVGPSPKKLKVLPEAVVAGNVGEIKVPVKVGPFYWRAVAVSTDPTKPPRKSSTQKNEVIARIPPTLIEPENNGVVIWNSEEPAVSFRWSNPAKLEAMNLEISRNEKFSSLEHAEVVGDRTSFEYELKDSGKYFWRVTGQLKGSQEKLVSEMFAFQFKREFELLPPALVKPVQNERLSHQTILTSKLSLKWNEMSGVAAYRVSIKSVKDGRTPSSDYALSDDVKIPELKVADLKPGTYAWSVASIDKTGKTSQFSQERKFFVDELPKLMWVDNQETQLNYLYVTENPTLKVEWQKGPEQAKSWKVKVTPDGGDSSKTTFSSQLLETKYVGDVEKQGKYQVEVEAFDANGELVARTSRRVVSVQLLPLLPAPEFAENVPEELMAKNNGSVQLAWQKVERASRYVVEVHKSDGSVAREVVSDGLAETLKSMMPGQYKIVLKSIDQSGRRGIASEARPLLVPDRSDARAPKIKAIKVK